MICTGGAIRSSLCNSKELVQFHIGTVRPEALDTQRPELLAGVNRDSLKTRP